MLQERLNNLAILSIEKEHLEKIDVDTLINDFASRKANSFFMNYDRLSFYFLHLLKLEM